jgi:chitinase
MVGSKLDGPQPEPKQLLAYLAAWADWNPETLDCSALTHVCFAFAHVREGRVVPPAESWASERLGWVRRLKQRYPSLKVLISVGGWAAEGFSDAALDDGSRRAFADSALGFVEQYGFDGVDLDWEYPCSEMAGIRARPDDKRNFTLLLAATRRVLASRYPLTIAAGAQQLYLDGIEPAAVGELCDLVNLMTYDLYNGWAKVSGHHANLFSSRADANGDSGDRAVQTFTHAGVPARKLVLGAAFYGRGVRGITGSPDGLMRPATPGSNFTVSFTELERDYFSNPRFQRHWDDAAQAPWLYDGDAFVSYEDGQSLRAKARYVHERGLAGMMFWEYTQDASGQLLAALAAAL